MIELLLVVVYVTLAAMILWRWRQNWRAEAKPGVIGKKCDETESPESLGTGLRCMLRTKLARKRKPGE